MVHRLSPREREVLMWIARGKTYADVAAIFGLSFGTIKTYLDNARHKLNATNATQACVLAVIYGIISADEIVDGHYEQLELELA